MSYHSFLYLFSRPYNITVNLILAYHVYFVCYLVIWTLIDIQSTHMNFVLFLFVYFCFRSFRCVCMYVCMYVYIYFSITSRTGIHTVCTCDYVKMISILIPFIVGGISCVVSMPIGMTANKDNSVVWCFVESSRVESNQNKTSRYNIINII